jgi:hypothetical protein
VIAALDSSFSAPSADAARAAAAAGVRVWCGYIATRSNVGLAAPWPRGAFENARLCGGMPIAYCSGRDDPGAVRNLAAAWSVRPCLDVEAGIRDNGPWVQDWLNASGAGLYGLAAVHGGRAAAFHVIARYPGRDPRATWPADVARPSGPVGWQWQGSHSEFGCTVDRSWLDDWFGGGSDDMSALSEKQIDDLWNLLLHNANEVNPEGQPISMPTQIAYAWATLRGNMPTILAGLAKVGAIDVDALATALAPHLADVIDEAKLAADLAPHLGKDVAAELATSLATRLANG